MRVDELINDDVMVIQEEEYREFVVESIEDHIIEDGRLLYYVKWRGWSSEDNTWEPANNLINCERAIRKYQRSNNF